MKKKSVKPREIVLLSDYGEVPAYRVDEYADILCEARQKFDRLCTFSNVQMEELAGSDKKNPDWEMERARAIKALDRYSREAFGVICSMSKLIHAVRDLKTTVELCDVELSAKKLARRKRRNLN